jgi:hypothetical protein
MRSICLPGLPFPAPLTPATRARFRRVQTESLITATDILRKTKFHAFPVIRPTSEGDVFVGMITREHLTVRLHRARCGAHTAAHVLG